MDQSIETRFVLRAGGARCADGRSVRCPDSSFNALKTTDLSPNCACIHCVRSVDLLQASVNVGGRIPFLVKEFNGASLLLTRLRDELCLSRRYAVNICNSEMKNLGPASKG